MPRSMTAFARVSRHVDWGSITCELRAVNHRFLETSFRLPETLRSVEMSLREATRSRLQRGKVDCTFQISTTNMGLALNVDLALAKRYIQLAETLSNDIQAPAPLSVVDIMRSPGVLIDAQIDTDLMQSVANDVFLETLAQLIDGREREGEKLAAMLTERLDGIASHIAEVRSELPKILAQQRQRLNDRLAHFTDTLDPDRIEQEMALLCHRADVDEELDRLAIHATEIRRVLDGDDAMGRRLDFLMQELNREANTLGSKSISSITTQVSVELKVLIEQMREQIQNIE